MVENYNYDLFSEILNIIIYHVFFIFGVIITYEK